MVKNFYRNMMLDNAEDEKENKEEENSVSFKIEEEVVARENSSGNGK